MVTKNFTAIILSYKRPNNIQRICETILSIPQVKKLILSNNNPLVQLDSFVKINDPRFTMIAQEKDSGCITRYVIASLEKSNYFFCIDDDLFFTKKQIEHLMNQLVQDSSRPHGFWGQGIVKNNNDVSFTGSVINANKVVDILNRAYFFTKAHVIEFFALLELSQINLGDVGPCDDIFLSFSGTRKPKVHYIENFEDCPTSNALGIACWRDEGFSRKRAAVLQRILQVKNID